MQKCRYCAEPIDDTTTRCPHCQKDLFPPRPAVRAQSYSSTAAPARPPSGRDLLAPGEPGARPDPSAPPAPPIARVSVVDVDMPFSSMVVFMVKWAIAAIPAIVILMVLFASIGAFLVGLIRGLGQP